MLIYLDTETTGLESDDRIVSIALLYEDKLEYSLVNPQKKRISTAAMALHNITNEMVSEAPVFTQSSVYKSLESLESNSSTLIAHNVAFDTMMLEREGYTFKGELIDTLRCAKHLIKECESYALEYLRYELGLYKQEQKMFETFGVTPRAHDARSDLLHVKMLFEYLLTLADIKTLKILSHEPVLMDKFSFGKYKGRFIEEICMVDRKYVQWLLKSVVDLDEDLRYSLEYYMGELF